MFIALDVSIQLIRTLRNVIAVVRKHDRSLAEQMTESSNSVALNVAEGSKREGRDRLHHFRIAAGSLSETRTGIAIAEAHGWLDGLDLAETKSLADREAALIHRLIYPRK